MKVKVGVRKERREEKLRGRGKERIRGIESSREIEEMRGRGERK